MIKNEFTCKLEETKYNVTVLVLKDDRELLGQTCWLKYVLNFKETENLENAPEHLEKAKQSCTEVMKIAMILNDLVLKVHQGKVSTKDQVRY